MRAIWKFQFETSDYAVLEMPIGAQVLTVQTQFETPCIWAIVDTEAEREIRRFRIYGTGHFVELEPISALRERYVGTYQLKNGKYVFHVFEIA